MPAKGSFDVSAEAPSLGAAVPGWSRVDMYLSSSLVASQRPCAPLSPIKPNRRSKVHSPANSNRASNIQFSPATYKGRRSAESRRPLEMSSLVCSSSNSSRSRFADVVLLLPVADRGADGVLGQHRAVNLHWR